MYNTILVPLDGSKRAERILPHVEALAHRLSADVVFLQIIEPHIGTIGTQYGYLPDAGEVKFERERFKEQAETYLAGLEGEFIKENIQTKIVVVEGPVVRAIIDVAEREDADLIAMASHGRTGLARVFYGSVAAGVLHQVDRPLLLVRSEDAVEE